ncbi:MAG: DUF4159 domain-containing protein [Gammaproteobacteria bacterium]|nr:DUF4159 domain-containing protein [Gammaproteobacteria bacterium]
MKTRSIRIVLLLVACMLIPTSTPWGQGRSRGWRDWEGRNVQVGGHPFPGNAFVFCRIQYDSMDSGWGSRRKWQTDYPESDSNFSLRLSQLTSIEVKRHPNGEFRHDVVRLDQPELRNYPFIYMIEVGDIALTEPEREGLRTYLLRGGFLMVDDFWGEREWRNWTYEFDQVLPPDEYPRFQIPLDHPIYHLVFDLDEVPQVPSINRWEATGLSFERSDAQTPYIWGVNDKNGRLMAVVCHNTDLGDGWEREGENPAYFNEFSVKKAYPMGINIVVYALTH